MIRNRKYFRFDPEDSTNYNSIKCSGNIYRGLWQKWLASQCWSFLDVFFLFRKNIVRTNWTINSNVFLLKWMDLNVTLGVHKQHQISHRSLKSPVFISFLWKVLVYPFTEKIKMCNSCQCPYFCWPTDAFHLTSEFFQNCQQHKISLNTNHVFPSTHFFMLIKVTRKVC